MTVPFPSWLEVDLDAVEANVRALRSLVGLGCEVAAVVKAQAYGLGAEEISHAALRGGATRLAVARVREGVALRRAGVAAPILVLSAVAAGELEYCCTHRLTPTVSDPSLIPDVERTAQGLGCPVTVHLKVDTGLTRFGAQMQDARAIGQMLVNSQWLVAEGLYTQFASADEPDLSFTHAQLSRFQEARTMLNELGLRFSMWHSANSAGAIRVPEARLDMVRAGITVSGYAPSAEVPTPGITPAATLKAILARTYTLSPGVTVGYGRTYTVERPTRAGLVPLGYADGISRSLSNRGCMLVRGQRAPIIGRVSMDQAVLDLSAIPDAQVGDNVVALGSQGCDAITLEELADWSETIPHEALCRLGLRLPRVYLRQGEVSRVVLFEGAAPLSDSGSAP